MTEILPAQAAFLGLMALASLAAPRLGLPAGALLAVAGIARSPRSNPRALSLAAAEKYIRLFENQPPAHHPSESEQWFGTGAPFAGFVPELPGRAVTHRSTPAPDGRRVPGNASRRAP